jgi:hypothetical protein
MATKSIWRSLWLLRVWFAATAAALMLASCGGGGGGGGDGDIRFVQPATPTIQGNWQLTVTVDNGAESAPVPADAAAVPTAQEVAQLTTSAVAELFGRTNFQGFTVVQNGATIRVTRPVDTDYTLTVNSIAVSNFQDCGSCGVGTSVSFTVLMNFTESGTFTGQTIQPNTRAVTLRFRFTRVS